MGVYVCDNQGKALWEGCDGLHMRTQQVLNNVLLNVIWLQC